MFQPLRGCRVKQTPSPTFSVSHRALRYFCHLTKDQLALRSYQQKPTVLTVMRTRLKPRMAAKAPVIMMASQEVKGPGITLTVCVRGAEVETKCQTLLRWPAGLWTTAKVQRAEGGRLLWRQRLLLIGLHRQQSARLLLPSPLRCTSHTPPPLGSSAPGRRPPQDRVSVPPMTPQPLRLQGSSGSGMLRPVSEIPAKFRSIFSDFPFFNCVQSEALDDLLYTGKNFVACAPTGSGKTVLFELAIIRLLMETSEPWRDVKAVYMAPIKALCSQCFESWQKKFRPLGLSCKELTGDTEIDDFFEIQDSHIILTTPEKWDSMTRKWKDNCLLQLVRLFLIDEVHVVKDATRGATLEVVVSRMKAVDACRAAQSPGSGPSMRFVAVSATIPNVSDIADWLSDPTGPATYVDVDESCRPVELRRVVLGFPRPPNQTPFRFDLSLNYRMAHVIQTYGEQRPALVFCSTRKGAQQAAAVLAKDARFIMSGEHKQRLMTYANSLLDPKLRDLVMLGVGYHHAGVELSDRKVVEEAFTQADLPVLFTTRTLAMGVNLPAHLVVVKSTVQYVAGSCEEYGEADLLQMIGRAGRPQFDTSATAVIMTQIHTRDKYLKMMNGMEIIESSLHRHLVEHLNAEIVLQTISDVSMALDWIRSTFLYIRALKNPTHYGFSADLDRHGIESKLQELCLRNLNSLSSIGLIDMDEDINIKPTDAGRLMARFYVACDTMKQFGEVSGSESLSDLIDLVSRSREFSHLQLRVNEKRPLNTLNRDKNKTTIRFPVEGKIRTTEMKVNCLIQAQLGSISVPEFGLTQDTAKIFRNGMRISRCLSEFLSQPSKTGFSALLNSLILAKCFRARLWENSAYVSKQLEKIGQTLSTAMVNAGLTTFSRIEQTHPRQLELILNRHPPFGNQIRESVAHLPQYEVALHQLPRYSCEAAEVVVKVTLKNQAQLLSRRTAPDHHYVSLIIGDSDNSVVFLHKLRDLVLLKTGSWSKKVAVTKASKGQEISVNLISSEYVGLDVQQRFTVFYSGAPRSGADGSCSLACDGPAQRPQLDRQAAAQRDSRRFAAETGSASVRLCSHCCRNKDLCGHDCCKVGVAVTRKRSASQESRFSSYLKDLRSRSDSLTQTPVKRLKVKMREESVSASVRQFPSKPKERLVSRCGGRARVRPPAGGGWAALPEDVHLSDVHRDDGQLYMMRMQESIQTPAAPLDLHQGSSVWSPAFSAGVNQDYELHLNQISRFSCVNPQSAHQQSPPSSLVPTITFELGEEWDDWGGDDDENLVNAAATLVASCGSAETRVQQSDCSKSGLVSCRSLEPRASRSPLRSALIPEITNTQRSPVRPQGRTRPDWNNRGPAQFTEAAPVGPVAAQTGTLIPPSRSFGFFSAPSSSASIRRSGREEESLFGIFDGIF